MERKVSTGEYGAVDEFIDVFAGIRIDAPHAEGNAFVRKPSCWKRTGIRAECAHT